MGTPDGDEDGDDCDATDESESARTIAKTEQKNNGFF
jgi:hypothetical protein